MQCLRLCGAQVIISYNLCLPTAPFSGYAGIQARNRANEQLATTTHRCHDVMKVISTGKYGAYLNTITNSTSLLSQQEIPNMKVVVIKILYLCYFLRRYYSLPRSPACEAEPDGSNPSRRSHISRGRWMRECVPRTGIAWENSRWWKPFLSLRKSPI